MSCDTEEALRRKIDVLQQLKDRAEAERDAVQRELDSILAYRQQHRARIRAEISLRDEIQANLGKAYREVALLARKLSLFTAIPRRGSALAEARLLALDHALAEADKNDV